jgi:glutamate-1-semialdehyde 2,1-aminomutase
MGRIFRPIFMERANSMSQLLGDALALSAEEFAAKRPKTRALHERAKAVMPGGNTRTVLFSWPFPIRIERAEGSKLYDVDGHVYTDFVGEYSAGIYGHSHPRIAKAVNVALASGINIGAHHAREVVFAEAVAKRFNLEKLRFTNSGTEANMMALGAARNVTGRSKIMAMIGGYHGGTLYFGGGGSPVNAPFEFVLGRFNDVEVTRKIIRDENKELAAIIVEPMIGSGGCIPGTPEFLRMLRNEATAHGIVLIFDEVMTSRLHPNGLSVKLSLEPDIKVLGKYIGGGMSFGAFGGRADIMDQFDPTRPGALPHAGTFNNNTLTMTAGLAGITEIFTADACNALNVRGEKFKTEINALFGKYQSAWQMTGQGSLLNIHPVMGHVTIPDDLKNADLRLRRLLFLHLLDHGIYVAERGFMALSLIITDADGTALVKALEDFLTKYRAVLAA